MELKICFLSTLFWNKDFISQESPILADVENINLSITKEIIKFPSLLIKLWSLEKNNLHNKIFSL